MILVGETGFRVGLTGREEVDGNRSLSQRSLTHWRIVSDRCLCHWIRSGDLAPMTGHPSHEPMIRDVLAQTIQERGQSIADARNEMGLASNALRRILRGDTKRPGRPKIEAIARYLDIPTHSVDLWFQRDYQRLWAADDTERLDLIVVIPITEPTWTWYGLLEPRYEPPNGRARTLVDNRDGKCAKCPMLEKCQHNVANGKPLACEQMLEREVIPKDAVGRGGVFAHE
jgi:transcriptional regulator with XRE-family HTH domain